MKEEVNMPCIHRCEKMSFCLFLQSNTFITNTEKKYEEIPRLIAIKKGSTATPQSSYCPQFTIVYDN